MDSRQVEELAISLEGEELLGEDERLLSAEDIAPVIEALSERGADFSDLIGGEPNSPERVDGVNEVVES